MEQKSSGNLVAIDVARGFAALSVFVYHYGVGSVLAKALGVSAFTMLSLPGASYAVPLFFAVSGYCIHRSHYRSGEALGSFSVGSYAWKRFWRIYPAYLVALLFSCTVLAMEPSRVEAWDFTIHLALLQSLFPASFNSLNVVLWTISVEFFFYLLYPFWLWLRLRWGLATSLAFGTLVSAVSWTVSSVWLYPYNNPTRWFVLNLWGAWLAGAWLTEAMDQSPAMFRRPGWWASGFCFIVAVTAGSALGAFSGRGAVTWDSVVTVAWLWPLSALILSERILRTGGVLVRWLASALAACGRVSYSLYLLHMPLMYFRNVLWLGGEAGGLRSMQWVMWFALIIVVSWSSYQVFERPFLRYRYQKGTEVRTSRPGQ